MIFWEHRESEDTHEKSIFLLFRQNIAMGELAQGKKKFKLPTIYFAAKI